VNWESYFQAKSDYFLVSPQCSVCDESDSLQSHGTNTGYYHSSGISGCVQYRISREACDMRLMDNVCQACSEDETYGRYDSTDLYDGVWQKSVRSKKSQFLVCRMYV